MTRAQARTTERHGASGQAGSRHDPKPPRWCALALAAICAAALGLMVLAAWRGIPATSDSAHYLSAAHNLAEARGVRDFTGERMSVFPPGLPLIWALGILAGDAQVWTGVAVNAAGLLACILLAYRAVVLLAASRALALFAAATVALAPQTWRAMPMAHSDPLYAALAFACLWSLGRTPPKSAADVRRIGAGALASGVVFLVRYQGLAFLTAFAIWVWRSTGKKAASVFLALALVAPVAWMARNFALDRTVMGPRPWAAETPAGALTNLGSVLGSWILPFPAAPSAQAIAASAAACFVAAGLVRRRRAWSAGSSEAHLLRMLATYFITEMLYVTIAAMVIAIDPVDERLLSALFAPGVVLAVVAARGHLDALRARWNQAPHAAALVASSWLVCCAWFGVQVAQHHARAGSSVSAVILEDSQFVAALRELPRDEPWFSNHPELTFWLTRHRPIYPTPRHSEYRSAEVPDDFPAFHRRLESLEDAVLVWWTPPPVQKFPLEALRSRGYRIEDGEPSDLGQVYSLNLGGR